MNRVFSWILPALSWILLPFRSKTGAIISPIFGEMRGKLGGNVYSRNKGGPYVRRHSVPTNPNSARQQTTRNWLQYCSGRWNNDLDPAERAQWVEFAQTHSSLNSLGQSIFLTGLDWYVRCNSRLLDAGLSVIDSPTDLIVPDPFDSIDVAFASATTITLTWTTTVPSGGVIVIWGSGPIKPGQDPNFRQMRLIGYSAADPTSPTTFTLPWTFEDGQRLKVYAGIMTDEGRVSVKLSDDTTYVAA